MKKLAFATLAALSFAAPLAMASPAAAQPGDRYDRRDDRREYRQDRRDDRRDYRRDRRDDRGDWRDDRRDDRRDFRRDRRDDRRDYRADRWDDRRYNGYYYNNRFYRGRPPAVHYGHSSYRPYYRAWTRGDRLPSYYRSRYVVVRDYDRYRGLRHPPRGYHWVRDDRGEFLLVGIATGVILGLALGH